MALPNGLYTSGSGFTHLPLRNIPQTPRQRRNAKVMKFIIRMNNRIGDREIKKAKQRFILGNHFYYHSKYGGKLKLILKKITHSDGKVELCSETNLIKNRYEIEYCLSEQEMREKNIEWKNLNYLQGLISIVAIQIQILKKKKY